MKILYPGHKVSSGHVVFDSLAAHFINLAKELDDILQDKNVTIEKALKWITSQKCGIVTRFMWQ